jgi:hypothetical protein
VNSPAKSIARLPTEVVDELEIAGTVARLPQVRSSGPIDPEVVVSALQVSSTLVTFAQIPQTFAYLSEAISRWRKKSNANQVTLTVIASGPRGKVSIELEPTIVAPEIESVLRLVSDDEAGEA